MAPVHRHTSGRSLVLSLLCLQIIFLQVTSGKHKKVPFHFTIKSKIDKKLKNICFLLDVSGRNALLFVFNSVSKC